MLATALAATAFVGACDGDDDDPMDPDPTRASFTLRIENVSGSFSILKTGVFNTPVGAAAPGPLGPGASYSFDFSAGPGSKLSLATMFVPSNDFFYAPDEGGIELFDATGAQVTGDVTSQLMLWDAGTEINQEPGLGPDQVQRQAGPNTGADDPDGNVRLAPDDFGNLPPLTDVIQVTIASTGPTDFTVTITNVSDATTLTTSDMATQAVPLSPGAWVVHTEDGPLFSVGQPDSGDGLEAIAEDGDPSGLNAALDALVGVTVPLSPGVWAVHEAPDPLFTEGDPDRGDGLEAIAEDGSPGGLAAALAGQAGIVLSGAFDTPVGAAAPAPIGPGGAYEVTFEAEAGSLLSFATMFVPSNDLFFAPGGEGILLFSGDTPLTGDITAQVQLWDAGTEVNEEPGVGLNQVQRQGGPNTGPAENGTVLMIGDVNDGFTYPNVAEVIRVTLTATIL